MLCIYGLSAPVDLEVNLTPMIALISNTKELYAFPFRTLHVSSFSFSEWNVSAYPISLAGLTHTEFDEKQD